MMMMMMMMIIIIIIIIIISYFLTLRSFPRFKHYDNLFFLMFSITKPNLVHGESITVLAEKLLGILQFSVS
jgi:ABC-type phosphate transport system permease subunit